MGRSREVNGDGAGDYRGKRMERNGIWSKGGKRGVSIPAASSSELHRKEGTYSQKRQRPPLRSGHPRW
jgi:hypothetical protein